MTDQLRVLLEIGPKDKRIVAAALDWPGLERWGRTEHEAVDKQSAFEASLRRMDRSISLTDD